ncbi:MAG: hypothetical protein ACRD2O_06540 [Terriglobia bacterium]
MSGKLVASEQFLTSGLEQDPAEDHDNRPVRLMPVPESALGRRHPALPASVAADFSKGLDFIGLGEPRQAAIHLERVLQMAPDFADGYVALGIAYAVDSRVYSALDHLERAVEIEPGNFFAHFKLGQLHFKLRVPKAGYEEMTRALDCATSLQERKLVAQLLREERQREHQGIGRPTWNRPFSKSGIYIAAALGIASLVLLLFLRLH